MAQRKKRAARSTVGARAGRAGRDARKGRSGARARRASNERSDGLPAANVVYIHGIGSQPPPVDAKRGWDLSLFGQDMGERTRMAYWADIRHPVAAGKRGLALDLGALEDGEGVVPEALVDAAHVARKEHQAALRYAQSLAASLAEPRSGARTRRVRERVLPLPAFLRRPITEAITRALIKDTAAYFFDPAQRKEMQERLRQRLREVSGPIVLVAHSQGSIIAYDVLSALGDAVDIDLLVTIGSPLGLTEVQDHVARPLHVPRCVRAWKNFADLLDPVALDKGLSDEFAPKGFVVDELVVNQDTRRLLGFNPHSSTGYLSTREVRRAVGVSGDRLARFFVAKDVAAEMTDTLARHPVLIELADSGSEPLTARRERVVAVLEELAGSEKEAASIDPLQRFVAARLSTAEIQELAARRTDLSLYCVWKNARKRKLVGRSADVIQAPAAHTTYRALGRGVHWAVLDTGIQGDHPHFATHETIAAAWDCTRPGVPRRLANPRDPDGHGTHVAGILAGALPDRAGALRGIAPLAKLHAYKVLDDSGDGEDAWIIKALDHVARLNEGSSRPVIHGLNLSLGGSFDASVYGCGHTPICAELRRLWQQGVVVCIAAGNEGLITVKIDEGDFDLSTDLSIGDPANLEEAIAVGSVNADKPHFFGVSYFSSRGPTADGRRKPDVVAPGERIRSCNSRFQKARPATHYVEESGTSMACPHVSGLLAAFLSARTEFLGHPDPLKRILLDNCTDLRRDPYHQGAGLPNLMRMLAAT